MALIKYQNNYQIFDLFWNPNRKQSNGGNYTVGYGGELERWNWMGIKPAVTKS
jgi:hypothetical protein